MNLLKADYLVLLIELRDAGKQLVRLFSDTVERSSSPEEWNRASKNLLEAELYVLRLDEEIKKLNPIPVLHRPQKPLINRQQFHPSDETQKLNLFLSV